jgi:hypothetical protein
VGLGDSEWVIQGMLPQVVAVNIEHFKKMYDKHCD